MYTANGVLMPPRGMPKVVQNRTILRLESCYYITISVCWDGAVRED